MDILIIIIIAAVITGLAMAIDNYYRKKALNKQVDEFLQTLDKAIKTHPEPLTDKEFEKLCLKAFGQKLFNTEKIDGFGKLIQVVDHGIAVFGTREKFNDWLNESNHRLGDIKPGSLLNTTAGLDQIDQALGRIEHGIF